MGIHRAKTSVAITLLVFTIGVVAASLANDGSPIGAGSASGWQPTAPAPLDTYPLHVGLSAETGKVPAFLARAAQGMASFAIRVGVPVLAAVPRAAAGRKVSLHLLDSILLI